MDQIFLSFVVSSAKGNAYPIEVAWAFNENHYEGHFIRPSQEWLKRRQAWDAEAEKDHGLTQVFLSLQGELPENIAERMNAALGGQNLLSGNPDFTRRQTSTLFAATSLQPKFEIARRSAESAIAELAHRLGVVDEAVAWATREASRVVPSRSNALADAMYWAKLWRLVECGLDVIDERGGAFSAGKGGTRS